MKYRIDNQIIIDNTNYGALGDDFSFNEIESVEIIIRKIESVILGVVEKESIFGNMCYQIDVSKETSSIFCYDEFLGKEPTEDIYHLFSDYLKSLIQKKTNS